jgi:hypothetical protein
MTAKEIVKEIMKMRGFTLELLRKELDYKSITAVANRLNDKKVKDMSVETLVKFTAAMNCEVIVRSKTKDKQEWVVKPCGTDTAE